MTLSAKDMVLSENMNNEKSSEIQDLLTTHTGAKNESSTTRLPGISEILPSLYLCGAGVAIPYYLEKLSIKCVINIAPELPDTPLPDDRPLYYQIPVLDKGDIDLKCYFDEAADLIEGVRQSDGKSLVHCVAGVSRSASICIAYLIKHCDMTLRDAFLHVRAVRPQIRPNIGFFRQLIAYEESIRGTATVSMVFKESLGQEIPDVYEYEYQAMELFYQKHRNVKRR